jgi:DNA adenine methylase
MKIAKPVLKWAGGKGQIIEQISPLLPQEFKNNCIKKYIEPFIGGGAVLLHIIQTYSLNQVYISDINEELILLYQTIQKDVESLILTLLEIEEKFLLLDSEARKKYYFDIRSIFNQKKVDFEYFSDDWIVRSSQIIFLNRTCFNGLFRVNSKGEFNVPCGNYKKPRICDRKNLLVVSNLLQNVTIERGDFSACLDKVDRDTFIYFDPPYRPIAKTSNFNSYSRHVFDDREQIRLSEFYRQLDSKGAKLMLSNSDPKNIDKNDNFFEQLYHGFRIDRINAKRNINSQADKRGSITELLITNY